MEKPLIDSFKNDYMDYRLTSDEDESFALAQQSLAYRVIDRTGELARQEDVSGIRDLVRQFDEIEMSTYESNDSVKEQFEREFQHSRSDGLY